MNPELSTMLWTDASFVGDDLPALRKQLTATPSVGWSGEEPEPICLMLEEGGKVGLPVFAGLKYFQNRTGAKSAAAAMRKVTDSRIPGESWSLPVTLPVPRNEKQADFFNSIVSKMRTLPCLLVQGDTGVGKTVAAVYAIISLAKTAIVIVPRLKIMEQWVSALKSSGFSDSNIGIIGDGQDTSEGKTVTVAMLHSVRGKKLTGRFGVWIWDEAHNLGATTFSKTMHQADGMHRMAMTATVARRDGCDILYRDYFGPVAVEAGIAPLPLTIHVFDYAWPVRKVIQRGELVPDPIDKKPKSVIRKIVMASDRRAEFAASLILRLYQEGRVILVVSEEIKHLQAAMYFCQQAGVLVDCMGLFTATYYEDGKAKKMPAEQLAFVQENSQVIFATYGMVSEGLDIPRIDAGVSLLPRADITQLVGRARRIFPGKPRPVWAIIRDTGIASLTQSVNSSLRKFARNTNIEINYHGKET